MAFSGDKQIVETILFDVSGSAIANVHSASVDMATQPGVQVSAVFSGSSGWESRLLEVDNQGRLKVDASVTPSGVQTVTGTVAVVQPVAVTDNGGSLTVDGTVDVGNFPAVYPVNDNGGSLTVDGTVTANVTGTVNLDRGNDANLPLFITGSISAIAAGVQQVTGSVALTEPVTVAGTVTVGGSVSVSNFPATQTVTGTVAVVQPVAVTDNGGSLTVDGTVTANVTGTVNLDRGNDASLPLFITGSISALAAGVQQVTGSVALTEPVTVAGTVTVGGSVSVSNFPATQTVTGTVAVVQPVAVTDNGGSLTVDGTVTANVTGTVNLDRGNVENIPLWVSGSTAITNVVLTKEQVTPTASGTYFATTVSTVTLAAANSARRQVIIYNNSSKAMYIKFGAGATSTDFSVKIFADDKYEIPVMYSGVITGLWAGTGTSGAFVTEIT